MKVKSIKDEFIKNRFIKNRFQIRLTMVACLIFCLLMICPGSVTFIRPQLAAAKISAQTASTDDPLDKEALQALIEKLTELLGEAVEDEDTRTEITEKWDARMESLVGKTAKQVINLLLADVESSVKDEAAISTLAENFEAAVSDDAELEDETEINDAPDKMTTLNPNAPNLPQTRKSTLLDEQTKIKFGKLEADGFKNQIGDVNYTVENATYKNQKYTIYKDSNDKNLKVKVAAVKSAVKIIIDAGLNIPKDLRIYSAGRFEAQNIAFKRDANWKQVAIIILGSRALEPMAQTSISVSKFKGLDKPTITVVHEIGHIIHERSLGDEFWMERTKGSADKTIALKVSQYANTGKKEFVAEVFAGSLIGMKFDADVIKEYNIYGGPQLPK